MTARNSTGSSFQKSYFFFICLFVEGRFHWLSSSEKYWARFRFSQSDIVCEKFQTRKKRLHTHRVTMPLTGCWVNGGAVAYNPKVNEWENGVSS